MICGLSQEVAITAEDVCIMKKNAVTVRISERIRLKIYRLPDSARCFGDLLPVLIHGHEDGVGFANRPVSRGPSRFGGYVPLPPTRR